MGQLEHDVMKQILKEQQRTNELLEQLLRKPKETVPSNHKEKRKVKP